jgi:hypothetical protein
VLSEEEKADEDEGEFLRAAFIKRGLDKLANLSACLAISTHRALAPALDNLLTARIIAMLTR